MTKMTITFPNTLSIPIKHALQTHTHKKSFTTVSSNICLPRSLFRPWVPDLSKSKQKLRTVNRTHARDQLHVMLLALKIFFQLSI